jgi:hypothetical protein
MRQFFLALAGCSVILAAGVNAAPEQAPFSNARPVNPIVQWNRILLTIVRTPGAQPATVHSTRSFAMMHAAIYDAVNAINRTHKPYLIVDISASGSASQDAAAVSAAHDVLAALYPAFKGTLDSALQQSLAQLLRGPSQAEGIQVGQAVAAQILALRVADGSDAPPLTYVFGDLPGDYQSTPPNFPVQPQFTHWGQVTPFALPRASRFRPGPPPRLTSERYSDALNQVQSVGIAGSTTATEDEALTGRFWNGTIQNYWNEITQTAAVTRRLTTAENARLFALLNLSLADSVIAFYDAKYTYNFWRPVTAIRAAGTDVNDHTAGDPAWLPQSGNTGADPSYPGAHAVVSAAAAEVLTSFLKRDRFEFEVTSEVMPGVVRTFTRLSDAENEASLSRLFAGQHFQFDEVAGQRLGRDVADFVLDNVLTPRGRR